VLVGSYKYHITKYAIQKHALSSSFSPTTEFVGNK
jgi:hypothetical protein